MDSPMKSFRWTSAWQYGWCWAIDSVCFLGDPNSPLHHAVLHAIVEQHGRILVDEFDYQHLPKQYRAYCVRYKHLEKPQPPLPAFPDTHCNIFRYMSVNEWGHPMLVLWDTNTNARVWLVGYRPDSPCSLHQVATNAAMRLDPALKPREA